MQACLTNPDFGYYASKSTGNVKSILGAGGDFITSPEISQVFGELMAIFFVSRWQSAGMPQRVRLVEMGPGRGTLLCDMLRTFAAFPDMMKALRSIELVEASPLFIEQQETAVSATLRQCGRTLANADTSIDELKDEEMRIEWFPSYDRVPLAPDTWTLVVAHEFFDALPIHIFEKHADGWREVMVDIEQPKAGAVTVLKASDLGKPKEEPGLRFVLSPSPTPWSQLLAANSERFKALQPGQRVEVSPVSWAAARRFGELVSGYPALRPGQDGQPSPPTAEMAELRAKPSRGGCGLIVDYGAFRFFSDSFRAFRAHQIVDPLSLPGQSDLTANVDFSFLAHALQSTDSLYYGPMPQRAFLTALGLSMRVKKLLEANPEARRADIERAAARLIDPAGMGEQYQVLGVSAPAQSHAGAEEHAEMYPFM